MCVHIKKRPPSNDWRKINWSDLRCLNLPIWEQINFSLLFGKFFLITIQRHWVTGMRERDRTMETKWLIFYCTRLSIYKQIILPLGGRIGIDYMPLIPGPNNWALFIGFSFSPITRLMFKKLFSDCYHHITHNNFLFPTTIKLYANPRPRSAVISTDKLVIKTNMNIIRSHCTSNFNQKIIIATPTSDVVSIRKHVYTNRGK